MKLLTILLILVILTGCSNQLGKELSEAQKIDAELQTIETAQNLQLSSTNYYKHIPSFKKDGYEYEAQGYVMPDGSVGYCKYIRKIDGEDIYEKTICEGELAKDRDKDWTLRPDMYLDKDNNIQIEIDYGL